MSRVPTDPSTAAATEPEPAVYEWTVGDGPLVTAAIHDGHYIRPEVAERLAISDSDRLREEDPFTGKWVHIGDTRIVGLRSRFEVDLNRPREQAVYLRPEDAWGLKVWKEPPPRDLVNQSLTYHDDFYARARHEFARLRSRYNRFVVFDIHSYNHRRAGADGAPDDPTKNPEVNIGTGNMDRVLWGPLVDRFIDDLRTVVFLGRQLDVRENVRFRGGYFSHWIHENFPGSGCALAIEFKKFFMNEWTGQPAPEVIGAIGSALASTVHGVTEELARIRR